MHAHLRIEENNQSHPIRTQDRKNRDHNNHRLKKSSTTRPIGQASPFAWNNTKSEVTEPTSPKVNCAGKIKVMRPKTTATKIWQSVMEEIEKPHNNNKQKKHSELAPSLSFKKEVMHLFTCLHGMRLDLRCFGTLNPEGEDNDDIEDEGYVGKEKEKENPNETSGTVFPKWLMVLQENNQGNVFEKEDTNGSTAEETEDKNTGPPPNALLLMRCRSAPVKSWLIQNAEKNNEEREVVENEHIEEGKVKGKRKSLKLLMEENRKNENLVVMRYDSDSYKISSSEIDKESKL
ncbi:unnamed protein product [Lupinus luteus]|uniref:Uncharacterized protein n=1 Tax=Lupinus luteus TaxID=3873 RepID=A0AAV1WEV0_LUPLU